MGGTESKRKPNAVDQEESMDVDKAWKKNRFDKVLSLLLQDSHFPKKFKIDVLQNNDRNEDARKLIDLYEIRHRIHQSIEEDNLVELKKLTSGNESKFYLNYKNESALFTAVKNKKFQICANLLSIGADFKDENEKNMLKSLTLLEKRTIENYLVSYHKRDPDAHILYLLSKSSSLRLINDFQEKVKNFYEDLDRIPEMYQIFQVIQHADFLDLVFDFDNDDISHISPTNSANEKGLANYKEGRLYIAAGKKRSDREILGTLAHELTHMAMELIYENECNPYYEHDENRKMEYEKIVANKLLWSKSYKSKKTPKDVEVEIASKIISETFSCYDNHDHHSELIVRVPQILAQLENGRELILRDHADLYNYLNEIATKDCQNFAADRNPKVKRQIRSTNESLGEIRRIREYPLHFEDVSQIQQVLTSKTKNIFVVAGESSWLCVIKTLQGIYGSDYVKYDRYLVLKIQNFLTQPKQILEPFTAGGIDLLVIECPNEDNENIDNEKIALIHDLLMCSENKEIVFAVHCNFKSKIKSILRQCGYKFDYFNDSFLSLCDLHIDSQNKILKEEILFQRKQKRSILDLIKQDDKIKRLIDSKIVEELIGNQRIEIRSEDHGLASLDGAYANLQEEIDTKVLTDVLSNSKKTFFVFEGFQTIEDLQSAMKKLSLSKNENLLKTLLSLEEENRIKIEESYSKHKFKNLCKNNADKDVYWIQFQAEKEGLFLMKLYTPNFYLKRRFVVYNKIVVQIQEIMKWKDNTILIGNANEEQFKITFAKIAQRNEQQNDDVQKESRSKTSRSFNFHSIVFAETENEAQNIYDDHIRHSNFPIYWLKMEGDEFVYVRSSGTLSNLRKNIDIENTKKCFVSETDVIENFEHNNPIIIADDPGMGKSTTIIKLRENKTYSAKYWILKVDLKIFSTWVTNSEFMDSWSQGVTELMVGILIEHLSHSISESGKNLARLLLKSAIYKNFKFPIPIIIFFDGFDELSEETDKNKIILLLQFLKNKTKVKFLVTTRLHCKNILEDSLGQMAWEFEPMDDVTKKTFIESYIKIRLNLTLEKKLLQEGPISFYAKTFLEKMASIFKVDLARFIGTPLQLRLLLEDTHKHFKDWAKQTLQKQSKNVKDPDFSFFGTNLLEIYSKFLDKKYEYLKEMKKKSNEYSFEGIKLICENSHMELAEILTRNLPKKPTLVTGIVLDCGIVNYQDGNFKFIHPTFREYYAAKVFMKWIEQEEFSSKENLDFICKSVLVKRDYHIVRCFLNDMFWKIKSRKIPPGNFQYFKRAFKCVKNHTMVASSLHVLIQEEHAKIFDFFTSLMKRTTFLNITCRFNDPLLIYACRCNRKEIVECILKKYDQKFVINQDKILRKRGRSNETCLHHAAFYNNTDIVKLILDKAWEKCSLEQFCEFLEIKDDNGNTALHLSASCLGQHFADINQEFMKTYFRNPPLSDFYAKYQWQYKYWFPEMPYELLSKNIYQVLFDRSLAAEDRLILLSFKQYMSNNFDQFLPNASNVFELILSRLPEEKALSLICATDASGCNSLHYAVANKDVNLIQKISDKISSPALLSTLINTTISNEIQGDSAIDITFNSDDVNTFQFLLELIPSKYICQTLSATKNDGFNILHSSVRSGKTDFLKVILNNLEKATCLERENILLLKTADPTMDYNTLHLAALYDQPSVAQLLLQHAKDMSESFLFNYLVSVTESNSDADALNIAVSEKSIEVAELLLNAIPTKRLYEAFMPDNGKMNALHTAALCGDSEITKLILQKFGLKLSRKEILTILMSVTRSGQTAMQSAIIKNHVSVVAVLLEYSIKNSFEWEYEFLTKNQPRNVIHFAIRNNYSETVKLIVDKIEGKKLNQILNISSECSIDTFLNSVGTEKNNKLIELIYQKLSQSDICQNRSFFGNNKQESRKPKVAMYRK